MIMVGSLKLILNDDSVFRSNFLRDDVSPKCTDLRFGSLKLELDPNSLPEKTEILFLCQPRREFPCLIFPEVTKFHALQRSEALFLIHTSIPVQADLGPSGLWFRQSEFAVMGVSQL